MSCVKPTLTKITLKSPRKNTDSKKNIPQCNTIEKKLSNSEYVGPGIWFVIHVMAYYARDMFSKLNFIQLISTICENHKCSECKNHCLEYMKLNPINEWFNWTSEDEGDEGDRDLGIFRWSWIFHNAVNTRLNKPLLSWKEALEIYGNKEFGVCMKK